MRGSGRKNWQQELILFCMMLLRNLKAYDSSLSQLFPLPRSPDTIRSCSSVSPFLRRSNSFPDTLNINFPKYTGRERMINIFPSHTALGRQCCRQVSSTVAGSTVVFFCL